MKLACLSFTTAISFVFVQKLLRWTKHCAQYTMKNIFAKRYKHALGHFHIHTRQAEGRNSCWCGCVGLHIKHEEVASPCEHVHTNTNASSWLASCGTSCRCRCGFTNNLCFTPVSLFCRCFIVVCE